jgi:predicted Zn-dependent protease
MMRTATLIFCVLIGISVCQAQTSIETEQTFRFIPAPTINTVADEIKFGDLAFALHNTDRLIADDLTENYLRGLVSRIRTVSPRYALFYQYKIHLYYTSYLGAKSHMGGHIFVGTGAIVKTSREAELIFWLAHEIAHAALMHQTTKSRVAGSKLSESMQSRILRRNELQADAFALLVVMELGYFPEFSFGTMIAQHDPENYDHPNSDYRARQLEIVRDRYMAEHPNWQARYYDIRPYVQVHHYVVKQQQNWKAADEAYQKGRYAK